MGCGLFGKLGSKRDFIALSTPQSFLEVWEPWVQACMSASRHQLTASWQNAFLTAPVWRFWLGADICGTTTLGAIMPSVDGIGRYYPLTLLAVADASCSIPPPDLNPQDPWFSTAEDFLLSTLDQSNSFERISAALDAIPMPLVAAADEQPAAVLSVGDGMVGIITAGKTFQDCLTMLRQSNHDTSAAASFWWTEGGGDFPPMALCARGMPDPFRYSVLLTGKMAASEVESTS
jgi:type VI secretion system protein ImpM